MLLKSTFWMLLVSAIMAPVVDILYLVPTLTSPFLVLGTLPWNAHTLILKVLSPIPTLEGVATLVERSALVSNVASAHTAAGSASNSPIITKRSLKLLLSAVRISTDLPSHLPYTSRSLSPSLALSSLQLGNDV